MSPTSAPARGSTRRPAGPRPAAPVADPPGGVTHHPSDAPSGAGRDVTATGPRAALRAAPRATVPLALAAPAGAVAALALPACVGRVVDATAAGAGTGSAFTALVLVLAAITVCDVIAELAGPALRAELTAGLRRRMVAHVTGLGVGGRALYAPGEVAQRVVGAAPDAAGFVPALLGSAGALVTSLGAVVALGLIDPWLVAAFAGGLVPGVVAVRVFMVRAGGAFERYQDAQGEIAARLSDALAGARTVRACGTYEREGARVTAPLRELSAAGHELWRAQRRAVTQLLLLAPVVELAVVATAGWGLSEGRIPAGAVVAAAGYAALGLGVLEQIESVVQVAHARAGRRRAAELLLVPAAPHGGRRRLPPGPGDLTFRQVRVVADGRVLLDDVDLTVPGGSSLALVGASGAGKSVLAALPGRLRDPDAGAVLVDGLPVTQAAPGELRRAVAYAFARPVLFGRDVRDALSPARPGLGPAELSRAAVAAHAEAFVLRLPEGYATPLDRVALSGGELQRLGLARALAQDARVVVMDDATSGLDSVTEHQVLDALARRLAGRTRLVVTTRASVAARADRVAWLAEGRLRAVGTHGELWRDPAYRAVFAPAGRPPGEGTAEPAAGPSADPAARPAAAGETDEPAAGRTVPVPGPGVPAAAPDEARAAGPAGSVTAADAPGVPDTPEPRTPPALRQPPHP